MQSLLAKLICLIHVSILFSSIAPALLLGDGVLQSFSHVICYHSPTATIQKWTGRSRSGGVGTRFSHQDEINRERFNHSDLINREKMEKVLKDIFIHERNSAKQKE